MPVFNTRAYLAQCLESLAAQSLAEIEVICVDNGSTDGSYEFLLDYAKEHPNFFVLRHAEGRQGAARNAGLERSRGQFIGFVDSDDFVAPEMFKEMYSAARASQAEVVECNFDFNLDEETISGKGLPDDLLANDGPITIEQRPKLLRNLIPWNKIYSRELVEKNGLRFPEGIFHEDQYFVVAAFILAQRIATLPACLYTYRRGRVGSVNEHHGLDNFHVFQVMELISEFLKARKIDEPLIRLVNEVKALKYIQVCKTTRRNYKRTYYEKMRKELKNAGFPTQPKILTLPEMREVQFIDSHGYADYSVFLMSRYIYRSLRSVISRIRPDSFKKMKLFEKSN